MLRYLMSLNDAGMAQIVHKAHCLLLGALKTSGWHHSFECSLKELVWMGILQGRGVRPGHV